jgi:ABC-type transporter Mla MlaB component
MATERAQDLNSPLIRSVGTFDATAAREVAQALEAFEPDSTVRVDLTQVRDFQDLGVAVLARALQGHRQVQVSGLRLHQLRLLKYYGVDGAATGAHR